MSISLVRNSKRNNENEAVTSEPLLKKVKRGDGSREERTGAVALRALASSSSSAPPVPPISLSRLIAASNPESSSVEVEMLPSGPGISESSSLPLQAAPPSALPPPSPVNPKPLLELVEFRQIPGKECCFSGSLLNGQPHGRGTKFTMDRKHVIAKGDWEYGKLKKGIMYYVPSGRKVHDGFFDDNGKLKGFGFQYHYQKEYLEYMGNFENGKRDGLGTLFSEEGQIIYCGLFKDDRQAIEG